MYIVGLTLKLGMDTKKFEKKAHQKALLQLLKLLYTENASSKAKRAHIVTTTIKSDLV